jgi:hypothetical protein
MFVIPAKAGMTDSRTLNFKEHFDVTAEWLHGFLADCIFPDSGGRRPFSSRNSAMR